MTTPMTPQGATLRQDAEGRARLGERRYRLVEMIPGALIWTTFALAIVLSAFAPIVAIVYIIVFDLFWLFRVTYFVFHLMASLAKHRRALKTDWHALAKAQPRFRDVYHVIMLPTVKEDIEILRTTLRSLLASTYDGRKDRFIVVLGGEARVGQEFLDRAATIESEFGGEFLKLLVTTHPDGLPGEMIGKGANVHWMGHRAKELIDAMGVPYEDVIVSSFDIDTCVHPQYFACLTQTYLMHPRATRSSYQPIALYNNNMWDAPAAVRVAAFGTSFWLMTELARPERLSTFSSHSMPLRALVDVGFWQKDIVTEDSRIFLQCLLHYDGDYEVTPLYVPVSMDTVVGATWKESLINLYKQQRRWAWGVEHFPYLISRFYKNGRFPLRKKLFYLWTLGEGMYTWATAPLIIFILGYLPFWLAPESIRGGVLYQTTPHTLEWLMRLAMIGAFVSVFASLAIMPPRPAHKPARYGIVMLLQWLLVPVTFVVFGAFPAIDAQTRLMLGKYLGFNVTKKVRKPA